LTKKDIPLGSQVGKPDVPWLRGKCVCIAEAQSDLSLGQRVVFQLSHTNFRERKMEGDDECSVCGVFTDQEKEITVSINVEIKWI
jgi:hypothetical protein